MMEPFDEVQVRIAGQAQERVTGRREVVFECPGKPQVEVRAAPGQIAAIAGLTPEIRWIEENDVETLAFDGTEEIPFAYLDPALETVQNGVRPRRANGIGIDVDADDLPCPSGRGESGDAGPRSQVEHARARRYERARQALGEKRSGSEKPGVENTGRNDEAKPGDFLDDGRRSPRLVGSPSVPETNLQNLAPQPSDGVPGPIPHSHRMTLRSPFEARQATEDAP